jgi:5-methylcytosine-specific restriction endonuclease McrA
VASGRRRSTPKLTPIMPREYIPADLERRVRKAARHRCGYCLSAQRLVMARLEIEHIIPVAKGGDRSESNLWLSCPLCNRFKSHHISARDPDADTEVPLFNPRTQRWSEHFRWSEDGTRVIGLTFRRILHVGTH